MNRDDLELFFVTLIIVLLFGAVAGALLWLATNR